MRKHGITWEQYWEMFRKQGGVCGICGKVGKPRKGSPYPLVVDHDQKKGIRGLLCISCNSGMGKFGDSIEGLMKAVKYLERSA